MRRRKEHEENDEDMYDDFGILKKKFRTKKAEADKAKAAAEEEDYYKDEIKKQVARCGARSIDPAITARRRFQSRSASQR